MAIEFQCPNCGRLMRTPDQTAGKRGKCPHCASIVPIPRGDNPPSPARSPVAAPPARLSSSAAPEKIEFPCTQCGRPMRSPAAMAGKKGKCPSCGTIVPIPTPAGWAGHSSPASAARPAPARAATPRPISSPIAPQAAKPASQGGAAGPAHPEGPIEFTCRRCGKILRTPAGSAGKKGKCPACAAVFEIPAAAHAAAGQQRRAVRPPSATAGLTPLPGPGRLESGLTPLDAPLGPSGLTPLDDPFTPLGDPGLTSLDDSFAPLGDPGLTPLEDPFASLGDSRNPFADPLGAGAYPAAAARPNPYQSPAVISKTPRSGGRGGFGYVDVLSCTWHTLWDNWASCLLLSVMLIGLYLGVALVFGAVNVGAAMLVRLLPPVPALILYMVILFAAVVALVLLGLTIQAGLIRITVDMVKGKAYSFADLLQQSAYAFPLLGAALMQGLIGMGLGILLALPMFALTVLVKSAALAVIAQLLGLALNVVVNVLLLLTPYLIVDQDSGIFDAISESAGTMKDKILVTIGLVLTMLVALAAFVGITLGVGVLLAMPCLLIFIAVLYAKATGQRTAF